MTISRKTKIALLVLVAGGALWVGVGFLTSFRATRMINRLLREWATGEVATQSDSLYALHIGELHFNWALRRVTLDSATITTDSVRNNLLRYQRPVIAGSLHSCTISGVHVTQLVLGKGLTADQIGCASVRWDADAPADSAAVEAWFVENSGERPRQRRDSTAARDTTRRGGPKPGAMVSFQQRLRLPSQVPSIRMGRIVFPRLATILVQHQPSGDRAAFNLARARLQVTNIIIDSTDTAAANRPLFATNVELTADSAEFRPDTAQIVRVGHLAFNLTDSTLMVRDFEQGPRISDAEFQRRSPYRRDRIKLSASMLAVRGVDRSAWSQRGVLRARAIELDSFRFEIRSDKRKPPRPGAKKPHASPQGFFARFPNGVSIDTVKADDATVVYEEFAQRREQPGRLTVSDVHLLALHTLHMPGQPPADSPMTIDVRGRVMNAANLNVHVEVPLDAGAFMMWVRGNVGAFDAQAINPFIEQIMPARIKSGHIDGVSFQYTVTNGRARGTVVPRYTGLGADITGAGMTGVLGSGPIGGILRGAAEAAQGLKVRGNNPDKPGRPPRVGPVDYQFKGESLPAFFWNCIKAGLLGVALK